MERGRSESFGLDLAGTREDAGRARYFLRELLPDLGWDDQIDDACLLVTELVANMALHAGTAGRLRVDAEPGTLRFAVRDRSPAVPAIRHFSDSATTGRGLRLVDHVATSWGVEPLEGGKEVWFILARDVGGHGGGPARVTASLAAADPVIPDLDQLAAFFGEPVDETDPSGLAQDLVGVG